MKKPETHVLLLPILLFCLMLLSSCGSQPETAITPTPTTMATDTPTPGETGVGQAILDAVGLNVVPTLAGIAPTRTPEPTATPDALTQALARVVQNTALANKTLFWLNAGDWINLAISLLIVAIAYVVGTWMIRWFLPRLVKRTKSQLDDKLLNVSGNQVRWLVVVFIVRFAIKRLNFVDPTIKTFITDICFFLIVFLIAWLSWRLISVIAQEMDVQATMRGHQKEAESLITLTVWGLRLIVILIVLALILTHFGVNITGFAIILGVIVFIFSLAGRDILTDIISGAMILVDRPFRIGDRLELPSINSWGDVVEIGMRSTKILSVENRMVVIPNSLVGKNQVVNYSYPDPSYFNLLNVVVAYDNDPDHVAEVIVEAIRSVEGVQTERDVLAWLMEFTDYHMVFWACWWVANYTQRYPTQNRVSRAIVRALQEAGVVLPYQKGSLDVKIDADDEETSRKAHN